MKRKLKWLAIVLAVSLLGFETDYGTLIRAYLH
jgi:hypothetical protein